MADIVDEYEKGKTDRAEIIDSSDYPEEIGKSGKDKKDKGIGIISKRKLKDISKQI
jgi:hypothetical protein